MAETDDTNGQYGYGYRDSPYERKYNDRSASAALADIDDDEENMNKYYDRYRSPMERFLEARFTR